MAWPRRGRREPIKGRIKLDGRGDSIHDSLASSRGRIAFVMPSGALTVRNVQLAELDIGTFAQRMFQGKLDQPVQVNCGLIGFTVRSGVAAADPILIDTTQERNRRPRRVQLPQRGGGSSPFAPIRRSSACSRVSRR